MSENKAQSILAEVKKALENDQRFFSDSRARDLYQEGFKEGTAQECAVILSLIKSLEVR